MLFHLSSLSSIRVLPLKKRRYRTFFELTVACCCIAYWQFGSKGTKVSIAAFRTLRRPRYCIAQQQRYFEFSGNYQQSRLLSQSTMKSVPEEIEKTLKNIVIIGGGIQGAAVAYYLSKLSKGDRNVELNITVLEAVSIASAASGKGGGFMAKTWGAGTPTQALHEIAFDLYAEDLTPTLNCTSYRKLPVLSVTPQSARGSRSLRSPSSSVRSIWPNWLDPDRIVNAQVMGTGIDTAQITPLEVTEKMIQATQASIVYGRCTGIELEDHVGSGDVSRSVIGVRYIPKQEDKTVGSSERPEVLPAHQIVVCAGPWSCSLVDWIAEEQGDRKASDQSLQLKLPMEGIKSTSIVFPPPDPSSSSECDNGVDATALFCGEDDRYNTHLEVYPRPDGTVYICGIGGSDYVSTSELRQNSFLYNCPPNEERVQAAMSAFQSMVSNHSVALPLRTKDELDRMQACMRPCPPDAMPYMGSIPGFDGLYINAGHNCWGIAWAPACGLAMAELLLYGQSRSIDLSPFHPARFTPSLAKYSRGRKQGITNVGEQW